MVDALRWQQFLYDLLWIVPLVVGIAVVLFAAFWFRRRSAISTVYLCFALAVLEIALGAFGSWRGGLELFVILGVAGDISPELLYDGWKLSWRPLYFAAGSTFVLLLIATAARLRGRSPAVSTASAA